MSEFEKMLAKKMEDASIQDVAPLYDKEEDWERLSARLIPIRSLPLLRWLPYAAAMLLIGLVSGLLIRGGNTQQNKIVRTNTTSKTIIVHDTFIVDRVMPVATVQQSNNTGASLQKKPLLTNKQKPAAQVKQEHNEQTTDTDVITNSPTAVAENATHRVHAVNLLDVGNEDSRMLAQQAKQPKKQDFFTHLFPANATAGNNQTVAGSPLLNLFKP